MQEAPKAAANPASALRVNRMRFRTRHLFVIDRFGSEGLRKLLTRLPPELGKELEFCTADRSKWHPLPDVIAVDRAIVETFFDGDITAASQIGIFGMRSAVNGFFRFFFRFLDPVSVSGRIGDLFSNLVRPGRMVFETVGPKEFLVRYENLDPMDRIYCELLRGSVIGTLMACNVKSPKVEHIRCRLDGARECVNRASWE